MLTEIFAYPPVLAMLVALVWAILMFIVLRLFLRRRKPAVRQAEKAPPPNAIVVDGSNVVHWGDGPSAQVIARVLRALTAKGYAPIVFFDANVGYVLSDHYWNEAKIGALIDLPVRQICVVSKGVVADEAILAFATDHKLRVVTNDRFRDWRVQFPHAAQKGTLVGGAWQDGRVKWRGTL